MEETYKERLIDNAYLHQGEIWMVVSEGEKPSYMFCTQLERRSAGQGREIMVPMNRQVEIPAADLMRSKLLGEAKPFGIDNPGIYFILPPSTERDLDD